MADVFVSYSRRDSAFVQRLAGDLQAHGKDVWVDVDGIRDAEVFPQALQRAIESSDAFVFVISPDAVRSAFCEQEVAHAAELNKRIVPVAWRAVPDAEIPAEIRFRHWIPAGDPDGRLDATIDRLVAAIDTDLEWERQHTRLTVKALEWDHAGRDGSFLVRGAELAAAERWLAAGADKDPGPTALEQEYLLGARAAASRRQRGFVGVSLAVAVIAVGLLIFALISRGQAVSAQRVAQSRQLAAESEAELPADPELSIRLAVQAVRTVASPQAVYALREAIDQSPLRRPLPGQGRQVCDLDSEYETAPALAYSPSGAELAEGGCGGRVVLFDDATGSVRARWHLGGDVSALAFSPDGRTLAVGTNLGIVLLDMTSGKARATLQPASHEQSGNPTAFCGFGLSNLPTVLVFSSDGARLAASYNFNLDIWQLDRDAAPRVVGGTASCYSGMGFTRSGAELIAGDGLDVRWIDARSGRILRTRAVLPGVSALTEDYPVIGGLTVSPDGRSVAVVVAADERNGGYVALYRSAAWRRVAVVSGFANVLVGDAALRPPITATAFSPDGTRLAIGTAAGAAGIWSVASGRRLLGLAGGAASVSSIAWRPDGREIATASLDGSGGVWTTSPSPGTTIATGAGLNLLAAAAGDGRIWGAFGNPATTVLRAWTAGGQPAGEFSTSSDDLYNVAAAFSPDGRFGAVVGGEGSPVGAVVVRQLAEERTIGNVGGWQAGVTSVALNDDRLVVGTQTGDVGLFDLTHALLPAGSGSTATTGCALYPPAFVALSGDGDRAAAAGYCGEVDVWNARTGRELETFPTGIQQVSGVSLSPNGEVLALASNAQTTTLVDLATRHVIAILSGDTAPVTGVAFSPTGQWIATSSEDGDVRVWRAADHQLMRLYAEGAPATSVAFSANGQDVVSTDSAGRIHVQDACSLCDDPAGLLALASTRVSGPLTAAHRATYSS